MSQQHLLSSPSRISYGSELYVKDGDPIVRDVKIKHDGVIRYYRLVGETLETFTEVKAGREIAQKGIFAVIANEDDREVERHYLPRTSIAIFDDKATIKKGDIIAKPKTDEQIVIASWDPFTSSILSEIDGEVKFENIISGVTVTEQYDEATGQARLVVNDHISSAKPAKTKSV